MGESTNPKRRAEGKEDAQARFAMLRQGVPPREREDVKDLPRWVKSALVYKEVYGESYNEASQRFKHAGKTLENYAQSPAGKKWREGLQRFADDPIQLAEAMIRGNALNITLDRMAFLEMAKEAGDFAEADKIARDLQDRIPELAKKSGQKQTGGMTIHLTLPGGIDLNAVVAQSAAEPAGLLSGEVLTDYEIVEGDD
jgi:hypothetical protein